MKAAVLQTDPRPGDVEYNVNQGIAMVQAAGSLGADLAVLPEVFSGGAEPISGPTVQRLTRAAEEAGLCLVAGVTEVADDGVRYNSAVVMYEGRVLDVYRKVHLFSSEKEAFVPGDRGVVIDLPFARIGISICYDLVFPEFIRGLVLQGANLIVNCTHWNANQYSSEHWGWHGDVTSGMAATRALENGVYIAMAARAGRTDDRISLGYSCIAAPSGKILNRIELGEGIALAEFDPSKENPHLQRWRELATYLPDRRVDLYRQMGVCDEDGFDGYN